jgi:hypothetical protein
VKNPFKARTQAEPPAPQGESTTRASVGQAVSPATDFHHRLLAGGMALSGLVLAARAVLGPLAVPIPVHSPLNAEACFGICLILVLSLGAVDSSGRRELVPPRRADVVLAAGLLCLVVAAFWRALGFYFLSDDFVLLRLASELRSGWLPLFTTGGGDGFFRPLGYVSLAATSTWAGLNPALWHACGLALHAANCVLVFLLALRLIGSRRTAWFAAGLFAIHGTRPEAVVWVAGRFDLVATFFVLAGLLFFLRPGRWNLLASLVSMVLAMLSKESAYVFPFLLLLLVIADGDLARSRVRAVVPFFVLAAALFAYRWSLFGGMGGYRTDALGFIPALKALALRLWAALFFPINWSVEPGGFHALAIVVLIVSLGLLVTSRTRRAQLIFAIGFVLVSALPPLYQLLIGPDLQKSRVLYLPSIGYCLMLAVAVEGLTGRLRWIVPGAILCASLVTLEHNLDAWEYASGKAKSACVTAAKCVGPANKLTTGPLPGSLRGVYFLQNGFRECVEIQRNGASVEVEITGKSPMVRWDPAAEELKCYLGGSNPTRRDSDWNLR